MTSIFPITHHFIEILKQTLAGHTLHQAGTAITAPSPKRSWQEEVTTSLHQTK